MCNNISVFEFMLQRWKNNEHCHRTVKNDWPGPVRMGDISSVTTLTDQYITTQYQHHHSFLAILINCVNFVILF